MNDFADFNPQPAVRRQTPAFIALAGPSGSGKTRSALELATGLARGGNILVADTEGNRALHYADLYTFDHVEFRPPYSPDRCATLIDLAEARGYAVLVVDSGSDEFEGEGGLQEIRDAYRSRSQPDVPGSGDEFWARTKARHKHELINRIRRARIHTIWCLRCEERVRITKVAGQTHVEHLGWQPICEKRFLYEMQSSFRFEIEHPGEPIPIKLYDIHAQFFPKDQKITRSAGEALAAWCAGGAAQLSAGPPAEPAGDGLLDRARKAAGDGTDALRAFLKAGTASERRALRSLIGTPENPGELLKTAIAADMDRDKTASVPAGIPERATAVDPEPKPPEAHVEAEDGAGSSSEAAPAERGGGSATTLPRRPGDTGTAGRAGEAGGSPAPEPAEDAFGLPPLKEPRGEGPPRDEAGKYTLPGKSAGEKVYHLGIFLRQSRDEYDINGVELDNAEQFEQMPKAYREDAARMIESRRKELAP